MQSFSTAHATTYGDQPHEHDGVVCAVLVLVEDDLAVVPEIEAPTFIPLAPVETEFAVFATVLYLAPQTRAPPPRAPPTFL